MLLRVQITQVQLLMHKVQQTMLQEQLLVLLLVLLSLETQQDTTLQNKETLFQILQGEEIQVTFMYQQPLILLLQDLAT